MQIVEDVQPRIVTNELARLMGDRKHQGLSRRLSTKVERVTRSFGELMEPRFAYRRLRLESAGHGVVRLEDGLEFRGGRMARALGEADEVVCFLATLGEEVDLEIGRLFRENRLAEGYILDALGSVAVENLVEQFHRQTEDESRKSSRGVTLRFSPGYCDWPITDQARLLSLFDTAALGVKLQDSCLIHPRKSVSGVFGVTRPGQALHQAPHNPCLACAKTDCFARRV